MDEYYIHFEKKWKWVLLERACSVTSRPFELARDHGYPVPGDVYTCARPHAWILLKSDEKRVEHSTTSRRYFGRAWLAKLWSDLL